MIHFNLGFSLVNHPFWVPPFQETSTYDVWSDVIWWREKTQHVDVPTKPAGCWSWCSPHYHGQIPASWKCFFLDCHIPNMECKSQNRCIRHWVNAASTHLQPQKKMLSYHLITYHLQPELHPHPKLSPSLSHPIPWHPATKIARPVTISPIKIDMEMNLRNQLPNLPLGCII